MAGESHERARSPAPWSQESLTPPLPLLSTPRMAVLLRACLGNEEGNRKGMEEFWGVHASCIGRRNLLRMLSVSPHEEVLLWMRSSRSSRSLSSASLR
jgi:hypothetical protein